MTSHAPTASTTAIRSEAIAPARGVDLDPSLPPHVVEHGRLDLPYLF